MGALIKIPSAGTPADRILARFNRDQLAGFIEMAISLLDATDGDPDVEANGDEMDGINSLDDLWPHSNGNRTPAVRSPIPIWRQTVCPVTRNLAYDRLQPQRMAGGLHG